MNSRIFDHTFAICAHKESEYLEECVKSIVSQSEFNRVIITTSTPNEHIFNIAKKYNVPVYINDKINVNAMDSFNFAIKKTETQYVTICHQDDVYKDDFFVTIKDRIENVDDLIIAFCDNEDIREKKIIRHSILLCVKRIMLFPLRFRSTQRKKLIRKIILMLCDPICCPSVTFNLGGIYERPIFREKEAEVLDWMTWLRLVDIDGSFVYIPKVLLQHRIHSESATSKGIGNGSRKSLEYYVLSQYWPNFIAYLISQVYSIAHFLN